MNHSRTASLLSPALSHCAGLHHHQLHPVPRSPHPLLFLLLQATGEKHTTTVKKDTFSPDWNETFTFSYDSTAAVSDLSVTVMDWDRLSKADLVGEVVIPADTLLSFLQQHQNVTHEGSYPVLNGGRSGLFQSATALSLLDPSLQAFEQSAVRAL